MSDVAPSRPVHVRTIRVEVAEAPDEQLDVTAILVDERPAGNPRWFGATPPRVIHDMRLGLRIRHRDLVITAVRSEMASHPYTICPEALPPLEQLVGLSISRGFTREVNERFGRQRGCAHLTALIHALAPAVRQGAGVAFADRPRGGAGLDEQWFVNSCQAWREEGPLHRLLRAGDEAGLRALSAFPPEPEPRGETD
ncbi:MAG TPA: DUF2889 domain-containing protein [Methylomirabilota bacterium]|nr:DUF2889 domain-containing protein [Methylomirabilota bacterium]